MYVFGSVDYVDLRTSTVSVGLVSCGLEVSQKAEGMLIYEAEVVVMVVWRRGGFRIDGVVWSSCVKKGS